MNVDLSLPENQNPSPELEEEEFIEVFTLPMKSLFLDIKRLEKEGFAIETRVVALAEGLTRTVVSRPLIFILRHPAC